MNGRAVPADRACHLHAFAHKQLADKQPFTVSYVENTAMNDTASEKLKEYDNNVILDSLFRTLVPASSSSKFQLQEFSLKHSK